MKNRKSKFRLRLLYNMNDCLVNWERGQDFFFIFLYIYMPWIIPYFTLKANSFFQTFYSSLLNAEHINFDTILLIN